MRTYSYLTTPKEVITFAVKEDYKMLIRSQREWEVIAEAVNQGIDSHLEGFTKSYFNAYTGEIRIHPSELHILIRRLGESENEEALSLRSDILTTLDIEEI